METKLAKITKATFGHGGYQDAMIGVTFCFEGPGWGINDFWGAWAIERSDFTKWTEEDRVKQLGEVVMRLNGVLCAAKVESVDKLKGIPVEVTLERNGLVSWRVLTEVL